MVATAASGVPRSPEEFADELSLLVADAVWGADATAVTDLIAALDLWADHPLVARAAALVGATAAFEPELQPLHRAIVRAAQGEWVRAERRSERIQMLRWRAAREHGEECSLVAADLLSAAISLCDEQVDDRVQDPSRVAELLWDLVAIFEEATLHDPDDDAEVMTRGAAAVRRLIGIYTELAEADRAAHLGSLAEAHLTAVGFVESVDGHAAAFALSERGVRLYEELAEATGLSAVGALDQSWSEHITLAGRGGLEAAAQEWEAYRCARLRHYATTIDPAATSHELSDLGLLLRRHTLHAEAVTVSARVVSIAEAAAATDESAVADLAEAVRRHGEYLHHAGRRDEAVAAWWYFIKIRQRIRDRPGKEDVTAVADGYGAIVASADELDDEDSAIKFGSGAVREWSRLARRHRRHLPASVNALTAQADRLRAAGRGVAAAGLAERAVEQARELAAIDPEQYRPILAQVLTCATVAHLHVYDERADASSRAAVEVIEEIAAVEPDGCTRDLTEALHNRALALNQVDDYRQSKVLLARAVALCEELVESDNDDGDRASLAGMQCTRATTLACLGDLEEALECATRAETIYAELAERDPDAHSAELAYALGRVAAIQTDIGNGDRARVAALRALEICDRLAPGTDQDEHRAAALHALARSPIRDGRLPEALDHSALLLELRERMAARDPAGESPELAVALGNHAVCLVHSGQPREAVEYARRSLLLFRQLAQSNPAPFRERLASALDRYAHCLAQMRWHDQAVEMSAEAVEHFEQLLGDDRALYLKSAALCLDHHAQRLDAVGHSADAVVVAARAVAMFEELDSLDGRAYLGRSLLNSAGLCTDVGSYADALDQATRAVAIFGEPAAEPPDPRARDLAAALHNRSFALDRLGRHDEAVADQERAVRICAAAAAHDRRPALEQLAAATYNLACRLVNAGDWPRAREHSRAGVRLRQELVDDDAELHLPDLAHALGEHGRFCGERGEWEEAAAHLELAVSAYEELASRDPQQYRLRWAEAVQQHAWARCQLGQQGRVLAEIECALSIWRTAAETNPQARSSLAACAAWAARVLPHNGEPELAAAQLEYAVGQYRSLIVDESDELVPDLIDAYHKYATSLCETGCSEQAATQLMEPVRLMRVLIENDRATYRFPLADLLRDQAWFCSQAGRRPEAVDAAREALALLEEELAQNPEPSDEDPRWQLAEFRVALADALADVGLRTEALRYLDDAFPLWEELADEHDDASIEVAWVLRHRARWEADSGVDARTVLTLSKQALDRYEHAGEQQEGGAELAGSLVDHARHLARAGRCAEALDHSSRALELWEIIAANEPAEHGPGLGDCLRWHATHLAAVGADEAAIECAWRALQLAENAAERARLRYLPDLAAVCRETALLLGDRDRGQARALAERSVSLYSELAAAEPDAFADRLAAAERSAARISESTPSDQGFS
ncbi:tetratricopeptide repeat protein [Nocardia sp. NPDC051787]|uniref:tetratricopeptide repeat protein n=1 Tax=Nocardia sp. NPDC051787 TaxID=3155415 RepID=UPI00341A3036